jgi:hypothetical protein
LFSQSLANFLVDAAANLPVRTLPYQ